MTSNDTRLQNLLFLLSAMPMATGCIIVSDDEDESETAGATSGATDPTTAGESAGGSDTSGSASATTSGTAGGGTAADETAGGETAADETAGETGEEIPEVCAEYGDLVLECAVSEELALEARELCTYLTDEYFDLGGEACQAAYEDFVACLNALSCEVFLGKDPVCEEESAGIDDACPVKARPDRSRLNH